ncbi:potassium channel family protein [Sphingobacterium corticibacter]|uniref:Potassium transporter TrkA n=1 Tax=Sphingobacterium corticibacter TaxID=2171749 RepID=A0A2T8HGZ9_9SPHI|nr:TrkA family potassium uptake protein [Sphingobacterium corticibacter]PVH24694.1 potassium transporter TrkA [Sphingobacterium corticibacter]
MKFIIIGLGNFGASLSQKLTRQGHEVIGVDQRIERVTALKEKITHTICLDAADEAAFLTLPLRNTDIVVVGIGENEGANIMVTALCKEAGVKRLISRAVNHLHEKVLQAIGVDEIAHPEEESAERWSKRLSMTDLIDSFELNSQYSIVEVLVPSRQVGKTIMDVGFREKYELLVLTILKNTRKESSFGKSIVTTILHGIPRPDTVLEQDDILVLYGHNDNIKSFL